MPSDVDTATHLQGTTLQLTSPPSPPSHSPARGVVEAQRQPVGARSQGHKRQRIAAVAVVKHPHGQAALRRVVPQHRRPRVAAHRLALPAGGGADESQRVPAAAGGNKSVCRVRAGGTQAPIIRGAPDCMLHPLEQPNLVPSPHTSPNNPLPRQISPPTTHPPAQATEGGKGLHADVRRRGALILRRLLPGVVGAVGADGLQVLPILGDPGLDGGIKGIRLNNELLLLRLLLRLLHRF